jgi:hypothetical protein
MPDHLTAGLALMEVFTADGASGFTILHADGTPLTWEEACLILSALAALAGKRMIAPPPIIHT